MRPVLAVEISTISDSFSAFPTLGSLVTVIVRNAYVLAGLISFALLVFGGFGVIMAAGSGDAKKMEQGKKTVTGAVVGLVVVVVSFWIVQILGRLTGLNLLGGTN
jgi:hypothetical protein